MKKSIKKIISVIVFLSLLVCFSANVFAADITWNLHYALNAPTAQNKTSYTKTINFPMLNPEEVRSFTASHSFSASLNGEANTNPRITISSPSFSNINLTASTTSAYRRISGSSSSIVVTVKMYGHTNHFSVTSTGSGNCGSVL